MKKLVKLSKSLESHWVGDGFAVRSVFDYQEGSQERSPFLLLDYAEPKAFRPTSKALGVGFHPHRGFETVTIAYQGDVAHADNHGNRGIIGPGDVQWMTAGSGILHEEIHGPILREKGGVLEMVQLWVNLPAKDKMVNPRYQALLNQDIPSVKVEGGNLRVIAGEYSNTKGAAKTFTPINLYDVHLNAGATLPLELPDGFTTLIFILNGNATLNGTKVTAGQLAQFERSGTGITIKSQDETALLVLNGQPILEPIVGQGPFVMNTQAEILKAFQDLKAGRF